MRLLPVVAILAATFAVSGCGGGGNDDELLDPRTNRDVSFIEWSNNPAGEIVSDYSLEQFKFTKATANAESCLYVMATEKIVLNYCHVPGQPTSRFSFAGTLVDVRIGRAADGRCGALLVDAKSGNVIDLVSTGNGGGGFVTSHFAAAC